MRKKEMAKRSPNHKKEVLCYIVCVWCQIINWSFVWWSRMIVVHCTLYNQLCVAELKGRVGWSHKGYCSVYLTFALMWLNQENFATNDKCINNFIKPWVKHVHFNHKEESYLICLKIQLFYCYLKYNIITNYVWSFMSNQSWKTRSSLLSWVTRIKSYQSCCMTQ